MKKRYVCQACLGLVIFICILYAALGEKAFPALRKSRCETLLAEGSKEEVRGRVYRKVVNDKGVVLYLDQLQIADKGVEKERVIAYLDVDGDVAKEKVIAYLDADGDVVKEKAIAYLDADGSVPGIGQYVRLAGTVRFFRPAPNPGNFDQRFYYQKQRIYAAFYQAETEQIAGREDFLRERLWRIKMRAQTVIIKYLGEERGGILSSMLLGEAAVSDDGGKEWYQKSGIGHILAISGLHVSFLGMGLYQLLRRLGCPVSLAASAGSVLMCLYAVMVGASVSAVRAVVMFLMRMGACVTGREYDGMTALSVAATGTLLWNPLQLFDAGFQLSYGAILGIYVLGPVLEAACEPACESACEAAVKSAGGPVVEPEFESVFEPALKPASGHTSLRVNGWCRGITKSLSMSLAIQIVVLPIMLYYYYEVCVYSVLWNLIAIPLASVILGCGIFGALLGGAAQSLMSGVSLAGGLRGAVGKCLHAGASALFSVVDCGIRFYDRGSEWILSLPASRWVTGRPQLWQIAGYAASATLAVGLIWKARKRMAGEGNVGKQTNRTALPRAEAKLGRVVGRRLAVSGGLLLLCAVVILTFPKISRGTVEIVMLNVGQGDSFFIRGPKGGTHLIDGGSSGVNQVGRYRLEPFLKSQGVGEIDYVWISHGDADHINGITEMLSRGTVGVKIKNLVLPPREVWDEPLSELAGEAWKNGVKVLTIRQGNRFTEGGMTISCLWPPSGEGDVTWQSFEGNEASMVLSLTYGEFDMLFTGDLEKEGEAAFAEWLEAEQESGELPRAYDVLKAGHHGSRFATGEELLETVRPTAAWISAGEQNLYGHPHPDVLERLANWGANLYNTKDGSAVKLCTDGKKYCILRP